MNEVEHNSPVNACHHGAGQASRAAPCSLLQLVLERSPGAEPETAADAGLLDTLSLETALQYYHVRRGHAPRCRDDVIGLLSCDIAEIDEIISSQVNAILHHPRFQRLEAAWRGVVYLLESAETSQDIQILVLQVTKKELSDDLAWAIEFDQSEFFRKVYEERIGTAGGEPFGAIIADYEFENSPLDIELLKNVSGVAASAFAPFISGAAPRMFAVPHFHLLERTHNLNAHFASQRFTKWRALRESEDSRFVGLTLPRVLMRLPYGNTPLRPDSFVFSEDVTAPDRTAYLWGNAAFGFGGVLLRAFARNGWFADIRGTNRGDESGGVVKGLPVQYFSTDAVGVANKCSVETMVGEEREKELSDLGFMPLCDCGDTEWSAFFANQSIQKPTPFNDELATVNARMSAMLQYILCASRVAHYLKAIARDRIGVFTSADSFESELHAWVQQFVAQDPGASPETRARFPLRDAKVQVRSHPAKPGHFFATFFLSPHAQLDELSASVKLVSELRKD